MNLLFFILFVHVFSQGQWQYKNFNNINIPPKNPVALQGYDFALSATQIQWNIYSINRFDCYLVDPTNFNLLKSGSPFKYKWSILNSTVCTGSFSDTSAISKTLIITVAHTYPYTISATYSLGQYVLISNGPSSENLFLIIFLLITFVIIFLIICCAIYALWRIRQRSLYGVPYDTTPTFVPGPTYIGGPTYVNTTPGLVVIGGDGIGDHHHHYGDGYSTYTGGDNGFTGGETGGNSYSTNDGGFSGGYGGDSGGSSGGYGGGDSGGGDSGGGNWN